MKRRYLKDIFIDEDEKKKNILIYSFVILAITLLWFLFTCLSYNSSKTKYITYKENSDIEYKVFLKDNEFFEEKYLGMNQKYIANVIDYVLAEIHYSMDIMNPNVHYSYQYRVDANVHVKDKDTGKVLYTYQDNLIPIKQVNDSCDNELDITQQVQIDYHKYNDMIQKFLEVYDLEDVASILSVQLVVDISGGDHSTNESVVSLDIPLSTKTVEIGLSTNALEDNENVLEYKTKHSIVFLLLSIITFLVDLLVIIRFIQFNINTRSVRDIYEQQLRKILSNYHSYIQRISNEFEFEGYQVLYVNEFTDLLEIRETISEPILMASDPNDKATFFIVPSNTKILYVYSIRIKDIKRELKQIQEGKIC